MIDRDLLRAYAADLSVLLTDDQLAAFDTYATLLVKWNERMNLTGITDPYGIVVKHFLDSLTLVPLLDENSSLIDVGTGAGFPAVPVAIARPDVHITMLDSLQKRLTFLEHVCDTIGLSCYTVHARAEDGGKSSALREQFDVATARAVASLPVLCEYCLPFVKIGGRFIAMKGPDSDGETQAVARTAKILGANYRDTYTLTVPAQPNADEETLSRRLIVFDKMAPTPKTYPRHGSKIAKQPLSIQ